MADKFPFFAAESGTWKTTSPNPHIDLSGTALTLGAYPAQTFKAAADDATLDFASTNTCTIVVWVDATHWARYEDAVWTDAATDTLDLSAATLMGVGTAGGPSNDDSVSVVASLPKIGALGDLTDVGTATATSGNILVADGDSWESVAVSGDASLANTGALTVTNVEISAIDIDGGTDIGEDLADGDEFIVRNASGSANAVAASSRLKKYTGEVISIACSNLVSPLTAGNKAAGTEKANFRMPWAMTLTAVRASVKTAPTGSALIVDINEGGTSILSTKLSIDATELTSTTAVDAAVISDTALADDAEISIDIDQIGSTVAGVGLVVTLIGYRS